MMISKARLLELVALFAFIAIKFILSYALINPVYELHRDEFLHLNQANHLAAGFTSVPPLTSLFSLTIQFLGDGVFWVKFFPILFGALTLVFSWLIVDELKGSFYAKCLVAVAYICSVYLRLNILLQPNSFDVLAWTAMFYCLIRYFETNKPQYLYYFAVWVALGFLNKYNVVFLVLGILPAVLISSKRIVFLNKQVYFAILLALLIISPNVIWQIIHHFPVIDHMNELAKTQLAHVKRLDFFKDQILCFVNAIFVLFASFVGFIVHKPFKKHIWVILTYIFTLIIFSYFNAKAYYALGLYPVLLAFGSVYISKLIGKNYLLLTLLVVFIILICC